MKRLKDVLINNDRIRNFISFFYNCIFSFRTCFIAPKNKISRSGTFLKNTKVIIKGKNNVILIKPLTRLVNCRIVILGDNCKLEVGGKCILKNTKLWLEDNHSSIKIGTNTTIESGEIAATEGNNISIGFDCMFAHSIEIRNGDSHSIIDNKTQQRINKSKSVLIGNHVWLGGNTTILKGTVIGNGAIIGSGSIVTGNLDTNCIYVGNPIKKVRENINWLRDRI